MNRELYNTYVHILEEELIPAMGCTEPIAIAYAASIARAALGCSRNMWRSMSVEISLKM